MSGRFKITRNMSTPESRAFWAHSEDSCRDVEEWPSWRRTGINDAQQRSEPRVVSRKESP